jgi:hypothetical protein
MFHPGVQRRCTNQNRRRRYNTPNLLQAGETNIYPLFLAGCKKNWLLFPSESLNYFQSHFLSFTPDVSLKHVYETIETFQEKYPKDSMQFTFLFSLSKSTIQYNEIVPSLKSTFEQNQSLRWSFKKLLNRWLYSKLEQVNTNDLVTVEIPKKPVYLYDIKARKKYVFEATTLLKDSFTRLLNHDGLILESKMPRNPYTNTDLTFFDCFILHNQLRSNGITDWLWEAFAKQKFSLDLLQEHFEVPMRLACLDSVFREYNYQSHDLLVDFIHQEYENHGKQSPTEAVLYRVLRTCKNHPFIEDWIDACKEYWSYQIRPNAFTDKNQIAVAEKTRKLLIVSHYWINLLKQK